MVLAMAATLHKSRPKHTADGRRAPAVGAPEGFAKLVEFFPASAQLARALGVSRETVRSWKRGEASRVRRSSKLGVELLLRTCNEVLRYMPTPVAVGRWMLTEQPRFQGRRPVALLQEYGGPAFELIQRDIAENAPPVRSRRRRLPTVEQYLQGVEENVGPKAAERARRTAASDDAA